MGITGKVGRWLYSLMRDGLLSVVDQTESDSPVIERSCSTGNWVFTSVVPLSHVELT